MNGLSFHRRTTVSESAPERVDIACFIGMITARADRLLTPEIAAWMVAHSWATAADVAAKPASDFKGLPVPIENWPVFDGLFQWESRTSDGLGGPTYLGIAVRSFFSQGGQKCYVVAVSDSQSIEQTGQQQSALLAKYVPQGVSEQDRTTWRGAGILFGLEDVSLLVLPDLPELFRQIDLPPPVAPPPLPHIEEHFVRCDDAPSAPPPPHTSLAAQAAPRCNEGGYKGWRDFLQKLRAAFLGTRVVREVQVIAAVPLPAVAAASDLGVLTDLLTRLAANLRPNKIQELMSSARKLAQQDIAADFGALMDLLTRLAANLGPGKIQELMSRTGTLADFGITVDSSTLTGLLVRLGVNLGFESLKPDNTQELMSRARTVASLNTAADFGMLTGLLTRIFGNLDPTHIQEMLTHARSLSGLFTTADPGAVMNLVARLAVNLGFDNLTPDNIHELISRAGRLAGLETTASFGSPADLMTLLPADLDLSTGGGFVNGFIQVCYPWVKTTDSLTLPEQLLPPDGLKAGLLARNALSRGTFMDATKVVPNRLFAVHPELSKENYNVPEAPVNLGQGVVRPPLILAQRVSLFGPTPAGFRLMSDVTTSLNPSYRSGPTRRLISALVRTARHTGETLAFESSGPRLWDRVQSAMSAALMSYWQAGALDGESASQAFTVRCDHSTMSQNDLDNGRVIAEVTLRTAVSLEQIRVLLTLDSGDVELLLGAADTELEVA